MNELFNFFRRYSKWLVFLVYVVLSCIMLFSSDPYRHHLWLTSASSMAAGVHDAGQGVSSYFNLREANNDLNHRNALLEAELINLREQLSDATLRNYVDTMAKPDEVEHFRFIAANVVNNSVRHPHNFITIDKGTADGVATEMGVINHSGVVGVVSVTGENYSRIISLLNPDFRLSCKIKGSESFGSMVWDGIDPTIALLEELPRYTRYNAGDTIITSGYSSVFPSGLSVGTIIDEAKEHKENFFSLRVKLFADFTSLNNVQVVVNNHRSEILSVEKEVKTSKK